MLLSLQRHTGDAEPVSTCCSTQSRACTASGCCSCSTASQYSGCKSLVTAALLHALLSVNAVVILLVAVVCLL